MMVHVILEESNWIFPPYDDPSCVYKYCMYAVYLFGEGRNYFEVSKQAKVIGRKNHYRLVHRYRLGFLYRLVHLYRLGFRYRLVHPNPLIHRYRWIRGYRLAL